MPKKPSDVATTEPQAPPAATPVLIPIASGDYRLPGALHLGTGTWWAEVLPDGRVVPQNLPPAVLQRFFPDLVPPAEDVPPPPTIREV